MYSAGYSRGTSYGLRGHHEPSSAAGDGQYWGSGYAGEPYGALSPGDGPASAQAFGFEVIPENDPMTFGSHGDHGVHSQRQAEAAVRSWRVGQVPSSSLASGLSLSARSSNVDLKEFLVQRGNHPLDGLHRAAAQGDRAAIMHLMKMMGPSAAIDGLDANGCSPLMYAVMADSTLAVEMLLNFRAHREQSCPAIQVYSAKNLDRALNTAATSFCSQEVELEEGGGRVRISKIFQWYGGDFGSSEREILKWVCQFLPDEKRRVLQQLLSNESKPIEIEAKEYNWLLNKL